MIKLKKISFEMQGVFKKCFLKEIGTGKHFLALFFYAIKALGDFEL